jgi:serine/threonine protein kinase/Tfp pilus assembly protein PilF
VIGKTVSHYTSVSKLGEGGMGVVYKAADTKLKRTVALKFLPSQVSDEEAVQRFMNETHAVSALDHPNICSIYEIGETSEGQMFIVMPCYEGVSLKALIKEGPLELGRAVEIGSEVARGLAKAHESGIIHRDVKPANILVTKDGLAKVVDFGLAKFATQARLTRTGTTVGTAMYMSPEQARGEETDERSDIWSLGVVLYEMATGRPPFRAEHEQAIIYSILNQAPEPVGRVVVGVRKEFERLLARALAKDSRERYQRMEELAADLDVLKEALRREAKPQAVPGRRSARRSRLWIGLGVVVVAAVIGVFLGKSYLAKPHEKPITSIAVLPFQNLSADPEQEYFSDGTTEALIAELSKIEALRVISRTSVMRFKKSDESLPAIARQLNVDAVVEGSVQRAQDEVRVTAQLVRASPEKHLWANTYTESFRNILALESEIAQAIAREIQITMTPEEKTRLAASRPVNPAAHEAYLKGKYFVAKMSRGDWYKSIEYFRQAIDIDSTYALAYAGMAEAYDVLGYMGVEPPLNTAPKVRAYAEKALAIDPALADGILLLADVKFCYDWDLKGAEEYYKRAIELDPNLALAHHWYGFYFTSQGRFDEGITEMKRGLRLDPLSPAIIGNVAFGYELAGEYDSASVYLDRLAEIDGSNSSAVIHTRKSNIYIRQGKYAEAIDEGRTAVAGKDQFSFESLAAAYALSGQTGKARETLAELLESISGYYPPVGIGFIYCVLGDREKALEYFEKGIEVRDVSWVMPALDPPWCDFIKSDPRYRELMKKAGIER